MRKKKKALITGVTGQDGPYLAKLLLSKNYSVYGLVRPNHAKISSPPEYDEISFLFGDLKNDLAIQELFKQVVPDEVYNLAAQSHIPTSFANPKETFEINYHGAGRIIKGAMKANPHVRIYQASTCEMFGSAPPPQDETTPFNPLSPYAESKLKAHQDFVIKYRKEHDLHVSSGILFHHESPERTDRFVTKKITSTLSKIVQGKGEVLELGNLSARVDWGYAGDYVRAMWLMLQQEKPEDYCIATGESHTVREFVTIAAELLGLKLSWEGKGLAEIARDEKGSILVKVSKRFYRPAEPGELLGNSAKAKKKLGWEPSVYLEDLIKLLLQSEGIQLK